MIDATTYSISPDMLVDNFNSSNYTCCICLNICFYPVMLECCDKLLCINCLENMLKVEKTSPKCPYCNNKNFTFTLPQRVVTRIFEDFIFKCPKCSQNVKYENYHDHIYNTCEKRDPNFTYCNKCHVITNVNETSHSCEEYIKELKNFEGKTDIEKKINILKLKILKVDLDEEILTQEEPGKYYNKYIHSHKLVLTNERLNPGYQDGWVCELCSDMIRNPQTKSYHCERCLFDVCEKCILYIKTRVPNKACHNHPLNLELMDCEWECSLCGNIYWKRRSWFCEICDFDACVFCYWKEK